MIRNNFHLRFPMCLMALSTISFTPFGHVEFDTRHEEDDLFYDEISARLLIREIRRKKREMIDALSIYFRVTFLHQDPAELIEDYEEEN